MTTIRNRVDTACNEAIRDTLPKAFVKRFPGVEVQTYYNLLADRLVTVPVGDVPLTDVQHQFIQGYDDGYVDAWQTASKAAQR